MPRPNHRPVRGGRLIMLEIFFEKDCYVRYKN